MNKRKVTLYVKSVKNAVGTEMILLQRRRAGVFPMWDVGSTAKYDFVLPPHQKRVMETVKEIAPKHGFEVEIVDVTRMGVLHRTLQKDVRKLRTFPTLITDSGKKLETRFSRKNIEWLLVQSKKRQYRERLIR